MNCNGLHVLEMESYPKSHYLKVNCTLFHLECFGVFHILYVLLVVSGNFQGYASLSLCMDLCLRSPRKVRGKSLKLK